MQLDSADAVAPARSPRRRFAPLLDRDWAFALALAFAVGVLVWFGRSIKEFFAPTAATVYVPTFAGQTGTDARNECARLRLRCVVIATQPSDRYPKDVVMSQQPNPGARVREGRQVSLVMSSGVVIFPMPDLRFQSLRNAQLDLNRFRLQLDKTAYVNDDDVPRDHVVAQDPVPLSSVRQGSKISLTLSKGPPAGVKVPNYGGMAIDAARAQAQRDRVHLGQIVWTPFGPGGPPRGIVVRQNPGPGATIDPFEEVSLQVSAGPGEYGYLIRQVHASATVPPRDSAAHVRIEIRDDTGTWNVYDGFAQGGQKLDFNVTAVGSAEIDTYINNELLNQTQIGREPQRWIPTPGPAGSDNPKPKST
jgi:eukaryotic-like serine/threonine-protein kinase